jgi:hypothetical protein
MQLELFPKPELEIKGEIDRNLNHTLDSKYSIVQLARQGIPYLPNPKRSSAATSYEYQFQLVGA